MRALALLTLTIGSGALAACIGEIGDGESGPGGGPGGSESQAFTPAPAHMRKLTRSQYLASLQDLLAGPVAIAPDSIEDDVDKNGFSNIGASTATISPRGVEQYETAALDAAHQAMVARRDTLVGCKPASGVTDDACTRAFLSKLGRRAYRRALTDEELDTWVSIANDAQTKLASFDEGLEMAITGILTSPNFLFRIELGEPDPDHPGWLRYTGAEMATRLSFFLRGSTPDDELLDAADRGELTTPDGVRSQAERLLASEGSKNALNDFFGELLHFAPLDALVRDPKNFPAMTPTLGASMRSEATMVFQDLVFGRDADFRDLFDSTRTFVNDDLANLYGLPAPGGTKLVAVDLPSDGLRIGLLGQAAFLATNAHATASSPTYRGKAIRERLLCESIAPPPAKVPPLPEASPGANATARQRLEMHRKVEPCASCHKMMDPLGLALENFDAIGAFRTQENGVTIDASGDLDGKPFMGPKELAKTLKADPRVGPCFVRNLYRHASGHVEESGEEPQMQAIATKFEEDGYRVKALALSIVTSDAFRFASGAGGAP
ncbi:MAG: DUF1592 domain-containing protein [Polyangiales bacterium]